MSNLVPYPGVLVPREGGPVTYNDQYTPFSQDRVIWGFIVTTWILVFAAFVPYISFFHDKNKKRAIANTFIFVSFFIGAVIMITNFGKDWQTAYITSRTPFAPRNDIEITAEIGLHIGFRGINVTLSGKPRMQFNRSIFYNEDFSWEWQQGNIGQGPYANTFTNSYITQTTRGIPLPVRQVASWFVIEGDYVHWGRFYRVAGWYGHILSWLSFVAWAITNILYFLSINHAALGTVATGTIMLLVNIVWAGVINRAQDALRIPFRDGVLVPQYGWCFYLNLFSGLFCFIAGAVLWILLKLPRTESFINQSIKTQSVANFSQSQFFNKSFKNDGGKIVEMENMDKKKVESDSEDEEGEHSEEEEEGEGDMKKKKMMEGEEGDMKKKKGISFQEPH